MSKQKTNNLADLGDNEKVTKKVVTETVEKRGGVQTKTTTITCTKDDFDTAFRKLDLDPEKFKHGGTTVTRQIIYTNSSGQKEVMEETVETFDGPGQSKRITKGIVSSGTSPKKWVLDTSKSPKPTKEKDSTSVKCLENNGPNVRSGKFEQECLQRHNEYRMKHGVPNLVLSDELCSYAKEWADNLAAIDRMKHRTDHKYGENIFMERSSDPNYSITGDRAVDSWYSEIKDYTFGQEPRSHGTGHFTQVVWRESKELGVGWAKSKSGGIYVVANYNPAGNFIGRYTENVPPPRK